MIKGCTLLELFPAPLYVINLKIDQQELQCIKQYIATGLIGLGPNNGNICKTSKFISNNGHYDSIDTHILELVPKLKNEIRQHIHNYSDRILYETAKLDITQSCLHVSSPESGFTSNKVRRNSIISGLIYTDTGRNAGKLHITRPNNIWRSIVSSPKNDVADRFSEHYAYSFTPRIGSLYIFPSYTSHTIADNESDKNRVIISFNTFYAESFGKKEKRNFVDVTRFNDEDS